MNCSLPLVTQLGPEFVLFKIWISNVFLWAFPQTRQSVGGELDQAFTANWLHLTASDCTTYIFQSAPKSMEIWYLALFMDLFNGKPCHIGHATLNPPCRHIPIFITFRDSALLSTTLGGQGGSVITKTKHLLNSWGDEEEKKIHAIWNSCS